MGDRYRPLEELISKFTERGGNYSENDKDFPHIRAIITRVNNTIGVRVGDETTRTTQRQRQRAVQTALDIMEDPAKVKESLKGRRDVLVSDYENGEQILFLKQRRNQRTPEPPRLVIKASTWRNRFRRYPF